MGGDRARAADSVNAQKALFAAIDSVEAVDPATVKVTLKNFGRDRRYPIVNRFRDSGAPLPEPDRSLLTGGASAAKSEAYDL